MFRRKSHRHIDPLPDQGFQDVLAILRRTAVRIHSEGHKPLLLSGIRACRRRDHPVPHNA